DLIAGERARQRVDADVLRLEVARLFVDLPIERGGFDAAGSRIRGAQHRILAQERQHLQPTLDQFRESDAVVPGDYRQADVKLVSLVLGAEIERAALHWRQAEPILGGDVGDVFHDLDDALPRAPFA